MALIPRVYFVALKMLGWARILEFSLSAEESCTYTLTAKTPKSLRIEISLPFPPFPSKK